MVRTPGPDGGGAIARLAVVDARAEDDVFRVALADGDEIGTTVGAAGNGWDLRDRSLVGCGEGTMAERQAALLRRMDQ